MADWFYYNANGEKVGPVRGSALKALAQQRVITPGTMIETAEGRTAVARKIQGLVFPEVVAPQEVTDVSPASSDVYAVADTKPADANLFTKAPPVAANPFTVPVPKDKQAAPQVVPGASKVVLYDIEDLREELYDWIADRMPQITFVLIVAIPLVIGVLWISSRSGKRGVSASSNSSVIAPLSDIEAFYAAFGTTDVRAVNRDGYTLLHQAVLMGKPITFIKSLVAEGANVNAKTTTGDRFTSLHMAVLTGNLDAVKFLVAEGAYVNAKDDNGLTPLDYAKYSNNSASTSILNFLSSQR
ncbi:MAG: ankyrin repeat domain-containing protein [Thermoguttaceae bacterium]